MGFLLLLFCGWMILPSLAFAIAGTKGRSAIGFGILGLFTGPLAVILAIVASPYDGPGGSYIECPNCAEHIRPKAIVCRFCGTSVNSPTSVAG